MDSTPVGDASPAAAKTHDRSTRRDEWSEGGVMVLLDEYESKWLIRNRAKLKGSDWEDIACKVSIRDNSTKKAAKSATQCKNKIESMKKRYRNETTLVNNSSSGSSWQFFKRMDRLLKGTSNCMVLQPKGKGIAEAVDVEKLRNCDAVDIEGENQGQGSNQDDGLNPDQDDSEFTSPRLCGNTGEGCGKTNELKRKRGFESEIAESIQLLADSILKIEQGRLEMYRESEKWRAEAEIRRAELELKSAEIMAKTQLQIAKLFVKRLSKENYIGSSSIRPDNTTKEPGEKSR